jgi:hypothetical protein
MSTPSARHAEVLRAVEKRKRSGRGGRSPFAMYDSVHCSAFGLIDAGWPSARETWSTLLGSASPMAGGTARPDGSLLLEGVMVVIVLVAIA